MRDAQQLHADVSVHGPQTCLQGVKGAGVDHRPWIASFPVCPILNQHQIAHVGLMAARPPYEIVRSKQTSTYFVACSAGRGEVLIDGRWRGCGAGLAFLLPAHVPNAFRAAPGETWEFCWVCYVQPTDQRRIWDSSSPVLARYDHGPLQSAIRGLIHEAQGRSVPTVLQHWVELVQAYVSRFARPEGRDQRLVDLWARVEDHLREDWCLERLADEAGYSREHLRRLCRQELGRSPVHQILHLRMRRAAELLSTTNAKIEAVAQEVGYSDPFVFSKAFHRSLGCSPSDYRADRRLPPTPEPRPARPAVNGKRWGGVLPTVCLVASALALNAADPMPRSAPALTAASASAQPAAELDRALRQEQLQVARQLEADVPGNADAAYVAGFTANEQGDSTSAIASWDRALGLGPVSLRLYNRADLCYNLGYAYLLREDYTSAVCCLRQSLEANPRRAETHYRLAHALFLAGDMEGCLQALDAGKVESALGYRLRGQANQQLGKLEEARAQFGAAIRLNPAFAEAYYGLAITSARLGDTTRAAEYRQKFDALKSEGQAMGRQARSDFDALAITRRSFAQTQTEVARVYAAQGQVTKAESLLRRAAEVDPESTACRFQLVMFYQQAQRNEEALRVCQEMIRAEPRNAFHYLAAGNLQMRLKDQAGAESAFRKVIELAPNRAEGYFALAQLYLQSRTGGGEALRLANRAVTLAPSAVNYYVLSQACAQNSDIPGARAAIETACQLDPQNGQYHQWRASLKGTTNE